MDLIQWKSAGDLQLYFLICCFSYPKDKAFTYHRATISLPVTSECQHFLERIQENHKINFLKIRNNIPIQVTLPKISLQTETENISGKMN